MASRHSSGGLSQLWQLPLFLVSLALFSYAAYLFIDPRPGLSIDQKIDVAKQLLKDERPEAAINQLNHILSAERLDPDHEGRVHLLLAQGLDNLQLQKRVDLRTYHDQIIEQSRLATSMGSNRLTKSNVESVRTTKRLANRCWHWTTIARR